MDSFSIWLVFQSGFLPKSISGYLTTDLAMEVVSHFGFSDSDSVEDRFLDRASDVFVVASAITGTGSMDDMPDFDELSELVSAKAGELGVFND